MVGMASLLLILSYLFSLQDGSGNAPAILLFAGLLMTFFLSGVAFITRVAKDTDSDAPISPERS